jgi:signal transduction histidine kinase
VCAAISTWKRLLKQTGTLGRVVIGAMSIFALAMGLLITQLVGSYTHSYLVGLEANLLLQAEQFGKLASERPTKIALSTFAEQYLERHPLPADEYVLIKVGSGPIYGNFGSKAIEALALVRNLLANPPHSSSFKSLTTGEGSYRMLVAPITENGKNAGVLIFVASLKSFDAQRSEFILLTVLEAGSALVGAMLVAVFSLKRILKAVGRMTSAANEIAVGDLSSRLGETGDDEVARLAQSLDVMLDRLESAFKAQSQLVSDLSHQLRTPLTAAKGHLELIARGVIDDPDERSRALELVLEELDHLRSLLDRVLFLGKSLEPDFLATTEFELDEMVRSVYEEARYLADRHWLLAPLPSVSVRADMDRLRGAIWNLVDNAIKATGPDDTIALGLIVREEGIIISVADSGVGMSREDQMVVFERFVRKADSRYRGSGLGLAIVKAVAEGHGGSVSINSTLGSGTTVSIKLPISVLVEASNGLQELEVPKREDLDSRG